MNYSSYISKLDAQKTVVTINGIGSHSVIQMYPAWNIHSLETPNDHQPLALVLLP